MTETNSICSETEKWMKNLKYTLSEYPSVYMICFFAERDMAEMKTVLYNQIKMKGIHIRALKRSANSVFSLEILVFPIHISLSQRELLLPTKTD